MRGKCAGTAGHAWLALPGLALGRGGRRAGEQDRGVEGHPFGGGRRERALQLLPGARILEERAVADLDRVAVAAREQAEEAGQRAEVAGAE